MAENGQMKRTCRSAARQALRHEGQSAGRMAHHADCERGWRSFGHTTNFLRETPRGEVRLVQGDRANVR